MQLPGGVVENGLRRRDWAFRPVSGALELALAEAGESAASTPAAVTQVLAAALEHVAGEAATLPRVAGLCVADRQFLMRELDRHLGNARGWYEAICGQCHERFDFHIDYVGLPVQEARGEYPLARVDVNGRRLAFRLPTGADQETLAGLPEAEAAPWLLRQLVCTPDDIGPLSADEIVAIEVALEAVAPAVVVRVRSTCPECGTDNDVELNPYPVLTRHGDALLAEVHSIASHYHWSEAEILAMPRARRLRYLNLIDRARGMAD
jgi:hypothetical protein